MSMESTESTESVFQSDEDHSHDSQHGNHTQKYEQSNQSTSDSEESAANNSDMTADDSVTTQSNTISMTSTSQDSNQSVTDNTTTSQEDKEAHKPTLYQMASWEQDDICLKCICSIFGFILFLGAPGAFGYGAFYLFDTAFQGKQYAESFNIVGTCYINETIRWVQDGNGYLYQKYKFYIYNDSINVCNKTNTSTWTWMIFWSSPKNNDIPYMYDMDDIVLCHTNKNCDKVTLNKDLEFDDENSSFGWLIGWGVVVCLVSCGLCCFWMFLCVLCGGWVEDTYHGIKRDKNRHYETEWKTMTAMQRIEYFMSYYLRNVHVEIGIEINQIISEYVGDDSQQYSSTDNDTQTNDDDEDEDDTHQQQHTEQSDTNDEDEMDQVI